MSEHDTAIRLIASNYYPELKDLMISIKEMLVIAVGEAWDEGYEAGLEDAQTIEIAFTPDDDPFDDDPEFDDIVIT